MSAPTARDLVEFQRLNEARLEARFATLAIGVLAQLTGNTEAIYNAMEGFLLGVEAAHDAQLRRVEEEDPDLWYASGEVLRETREYVRRGVLEALGMEGEQ